MCCNCSRRTAGTPLNQCMPYIFLLGSEGATRPDEVLFASCEGNDTLAVVDLHTAAANRSVKATVAPHVSLLTAQRRPPCDSMIERQMASPIPIPCCLVVKNGSNARRASS